MSFAKLQKYPFVCWICLRPEDGKSMTSLDTEQECFEGTIRNYLAAMTAAVDELQLDLPYSKSFKKFKISVFNLLKKLSLFTLTCPDSPQMTVLEILVSVRELHVLVDKHHLFPRSVCSACLKSLESYARFGTKVRTVHALMNGLVELRQGNEEPIREVFRTNGSTMIHELKLSRANDVKVDDLIGEFPMLEIASLPASLVNCFYVDKIEIKQEVVEDPGEDWLDEEPEGNLLFQVECLPEEQVELKEESNVFVSPLELVDDDGIEKELKPVKEKRKRRKMKDPDSDAKVRTKESKLEEPLLCTKCPYKAFYAYLMRKHEKSHDRKIFNCNRPDCTESFPSYSALSVHKEVKHRSWFCELCGKQFVHRSSYSAHMIRAHGDGELKFTCEYCQLKFKLIADLRIHVRNMHKPRKKICKCETCGKEFRVNSLLVKHKLWHSDEYNYPCPQCDKKFKNKAALGKHTVQVHQERLFQCEHCLRPFATRGMLLDHIEHVHEIQMRFVCDVCLAVFDSRQSLATHLSRHQNPKFLECGQCLSVLLTEEQLQDHLCITYRDDYVCCGRDLHSYQQYNRHQLVEHGRKMNVRVKPIPGVLLGRLRATRKRIETCRKCKAIFDTRKARDEHMKECVGSEASATIDH